MDSDHVPVYLVVLLSPYEEVIGYGDSSLQFSGGFLNDQQEIVEYYQTHRLWLWFFDEGKTILVEELPLFLEDGKLWC